jgi:hypothetical protein
MSSVRMKTTFFCEEAPCASRAAKPAPTIASSATAAARVIHARACVGLGLGSGMRRT